MSNRDETTTISINMKPGATLEEKIHLAEVFGEIGEVCEDPEGFVVYYEGVLEVDDIKKHMVGWNDKFSAVACVTRPCEETVYDNEGVVDEKNGADEQI